MSVRKSLVVWALGVVVAVSGLGGGFNRGVTMSVRRCRVGRNSVLKLIKGGNTKGAALFQLVLSLLGTSGKGMIVGSVSMDLGRS